MTKGVFISYATPDLSLARRIHAALQEAGITCWLAPESVPAGSAWALQIGKAIRHGCDTLILIWSQAAQESKWVPRELILAVSYELVIIACPTGQFKPREDFELLLAGVHSSVALLSDNPQPQVDQIVRTVCNMHVPDRPKRSIRDECDRISIPVIAGQNVTWVLIPPGVVDGIRNESPFYIAQEPIPYRLLQQVMADRPVSAERHVRGCSFAEARRFVAAVTRMRQGCGSSDTIDLPLAHQWLYATALAQVLVRSSRSTPIIPLASLLESGWVWCWHDVTRTDFELRNAQNVDSSGRIDTQHAWPIASDSFATADTVVRPVFLPGEWRTNVRGV